MTSSLLHKNRYPPRNSTTTSPVRAKSSSTFRPCSRVTFTFMWTLTLASKFNIGSMLTQTDSLRLRLLYQYHSAKVDAGVYARANVKCKQTFNAVSDLRSEILDARPCPPSREPIFFNFMQLLGNFGKSVCWRPLKGWFPWICHCLRRNLRTTNTRLKPTYVVPSNQGPLSFYMRDPVYNGRATEALRVNSR